MVIKNRSKICLLISACIILVALVMTICGRGLNLGIDFEGGLSIQYDLKEDNVSRADVEKVLSDLDIGAFTITQQGASEIIICLKDVKPVENAAAETAAEKAAEAAETVTEEAAAVTEEASEAAEAVTEEASEAAEAVTEEAAETAEAVTEEAAETAETVAEETAAVTEEAAEAAETVAEEAAAVTEEAADAAETVTEEAVETAETVAEEAAETVENAAEEVAETAGKAAAAVTNSEDATIEAIQSKISEGIMKAYPNAVHKSTSYVGPVAGASLVKNAILSVLIAAALMLIYIAIRFDLNSGLAAVFGLIHDVLIMLSIMIIFQIQMNSPFIAAALTIVGYSINNTIVIFDRIRENAKKMPNTAREEVTNISIKESLGRTICTTVTTLITVTLLCILGVTSIREFALPIIIGIVAGVYSANMINGYVWAFLEEKRRARKAKA